MCLRTINKVLHLQRANRSSLSRFSKVGELPEVSVAERVTKTRLSWRQEENNTASEAQDGLFARARKQIMPAAR